MIYIFINVIGSKTRKNKSIKNPLRLNSKVSKCTTQQANYLTWV